MLSVPDLQQNVNTTLNKTHGKATRPQTHKAKLTIRSINFKNLHLVRPTRLNSQKDL